MRKNKILITGSTGFLGYEFLKKVRNKKIYFITKKKVISKFKNHINIICDLTNKKETISAVGKINPTIIYHFAWYGIPIFNKKNFKINKIITKNLIKAINNSNCKKIIIAGSCAEYGNLTSEVKESDPINKKQSPLGKQKNYIRKLFYENLNKNRIIIWTRIFYVYGPSQRTGSLIKYLMRNNSIYLKNPNQFNDFIYINDVISALLLVKKINNSVIINICSGRPISNLNFVKLFVHLSSKDYTIFKNKFNKKKVFYGSNKLLKTIGWKEMYSIKKGLKELVN